LFLFSYSGTTNDLLEGTKEIDADKKIIITKGEQAKITVSTRIMKENILSYRTSNNKGKERGFLSFEGTMAPASLFLKLYFDETNNGSAERFIMDSINYWNKYFNIYFKDNNNFLKSVIKIGSSLNIFTGDYTTSASYDLESKIIESGLFNAMLHDKKNFSHGRFINYEHISENINIYFRQKEISRYEENLLGYIKNGKNIIIKSNYDGILCEYDLLIASQYFMYYISNFLNIDISKPTYNEEAMKIYFYKGNL
jgi:hypothetical protein